MFFFAFAFYIIMIDLPLLATNIKLRITLLPISKVMSGSPSNNARIDRNLRERHRRLHIRELFARLALVLPARGTRGPVMDVVDEAISHIRLCQERIMMLRTRFQQLSGREDHNLPEISVSPISSDELEVNLRVSESNGRINLLEVIHILEDEGAEITSLSYSVVHGQLLGTIRSKAIYARIGIEISNVQERLRQLSSRYN